MKKNQILTLAIAFGLFLSSCGSLCLSVSKMRYTKGLNIGVFAAKDAKPEELKAKKAEKKQVNKVAEIQSTEIVSNDIIIENKNVELNQQEQLDGKTIISGNKTVNKKINKIQKSLPIMNSIKVENLAQQNLQKDIKSTDNDSDVALLILVILAIIIPPLAVYLYYGEINTQFWISLILCLLAGGLFGIGGLYFGWGIPVIHALLVIFGILG